MLNEKLLNGLAIFASSYVKRWMESNYDKLMRSAPARSLMECGEPTRYGIEAALYALLAYADQHWSPGTPLGRVIHEVAMDAPAEVSKRLVNGFREEVLSSSGKPAPEQINNLEQTLLRLDDATLGALLAWVARTSTSDRAKIRSLLSTLSDEQLQKIARLAPEDLEALAETSPPGAKPPSRLARAIGDELEQAHRRTDALLAAQRARRHA